jgi:hypothetical protein
MPAAADLDERVQSAAADRPSSIVATRKIAAGVSGARTG